MLSREHQQYLRLEGDSAPAEEMLNNPQQRGYPMPLLSGGRGSSLTASRDAATQCEDKHAAEQRQQRARSANARSTREYADGSAEASGVPGFPGMGSWELESKKRMKEHATYSRCVSATGSRRERRKPSKMYVDDSVSPAGFRGMSAGDGAVRRQKQKEYSNALELQIQEKTSRSLSKRICSLGEPAEHSLWDSLGMHDTAASTRLQKWKCELDAQLIELQQAKAKRKEDERAHEEFLDAQIQRYLEDTRLRINREQEEKALREKRHQLILAQTLQKHVEAHAETARSVASRAANRAARRAVSRSHSPLGSRLPSRRMGRTRSHPSPDGWTRSDLASIDDEPEASDIAFRSRLPRHSVAYAPFPEQSDKVNGDIPARASSSTASPGHTTMTLSSSIALPGHQRPDSSSATSAHRASSAMTPEVRASLMTLDDAMCASVLAPLSADMRESVTLSSLALTDSTTRTSAIGAKPKSASLRATRASIAALDPPCAAPSCASPMPLPWIWTARRETPCADIDPIALRRWGHKDPSSTQEGTRSAYAAEMFLQNTPVTRGAVAALDPQAPSAVAVTDPGILSSLARVDPTTRVSCLEGHPHTTPALSSHAATQQRSGFPWTRSRGVLDSTTREALERMAPVLAAHVCTSRGGGSLDADARASVLASHPATRDVFLALSPRECATLCTIDPTTVAGSRLQNHDKKESGLSGKPSTGATSPAAWGLSAASTPTSGASSSGGRFHVDARSPLRQAGRTQMCTNDAMARMAYNEREVDRHSESLTSLLTQIANNEAREAELEVLLDVRNGAWRGNTKNDVRTTARAVLHDSVERAHRGAHLGDRDRQESGSTEEDAETWRQDMMKEVEKNYRRVVGNVW